MKRVISLAVIVCITIGIAYFHYSIRQVQMLTCNEVTVQLVGLSYGVDICPIVNKSVNIASNSEVAYPGLQPPIKIYTSYQIFSDQVNDPDDDYVVSGFTRTDGSIHVHLNINNKQQAINTLAHELVHSHQIAVLGDNFTEVNLWVLEGYAEYITQEWKVKACTVANPRKAMDQYKHEEYFMYWLQAVAALQRGIEPIELHRLDIKQVQETDLVVSLNEYMSNHCLNFSA